MSGNEVVLTPEHWQPITPYLKRARVPGFADGGAVSLPAPSFAQPASDQPIIIKEINLTVVLGKDDTSKVVLDGMSTPSGRKVVVKHVRAAALRREL